jgi:hypothetical protein
MFLVESIEIGNDGVMKLGTSTYNSPVVATIRNPETFPETWNTLGTLYKIIPVNINQDIQVCISEQRRIYINLPNFCDFGVSDFRLGILPVRWLYSQAETRYFLDIYA